MPKTTPAPEKTFTIPETVTVPSEAVIATLALIEGYESACSSITNTNLETFEELRGDGPRRLRVALQRGRDDDEAWEAAYNVTYDRGEAISKLIRDLLETGDSVRKQLRKLAEDVIGVHWIVEGVDGAGYWMGGGGRYGDAS